MNGSKIKKFFVNSDVGSVLFALVALCILWTCLTPYFFTFANVKNLAVYSSYTGIMACGLTAVMLTGCIDLSQMPLMACCGMFLGLAYQRGAGNVVLWIVAILVGVIGGAVNGFVVTKMKIVPMIATLGTQLIFRGISFLTTNGTYITIKDPMIRSIGYDKFIEMPVMFYIMIVVIAITWFMCKYTQFGRNLYSTGSSPQAAHLAGINVELTKFFAFVFSGICCGIAGVVYTAQSGLALNNAGTGAEMDVMAAVVIGGTSLAGGRGKVINTMLGVLLMSVLANGMGLLGIDSYFQMIFKGAILIAAVFIDTLRNGGKNA